MISEANYGVRFGEPNSRAWCVRAAYPDKSAFAYGTIYAPRDAQQHELEKCAYTFMHRVLPEGFKIVNMVPGSLVFIPEEENG